MDPYNHRSPLNTSCIQLGTPAVNTLFPVYFEVSLLELSIRKKGTPIVPALTLAPLVAHFPWRSITPPLVPGGIASGLV